MALGHTDGKGSIAAEMKLCVYMIFVKYKEHAVFL